MNVNASSEFVIVSVDSWHKREDYEAMQGVRLYVAKINSRPN